MPEQPDLLKQHLDDLHALLLEERQVLLEGSAARIAAIADTKLKLLQDIERLAADPGYASPDRDTLLRLGRYNRENGVICDTMLRHFTAAIDSLRLHDPHRSYTVSGGEQKTRPVTLALGTA